jgi:hypothetical protein
MKRVPAFSARPEATEFLEKINELVACGEENTHVEPGIKRPIFFVVGAPRSGTTLLMQWLQSIGVSVPTNVAARFSRNPLFAGMLQRLLIDSSLNYRNELTVSLPDAAYQSDYGKTSGLLSPHEFSFYIRRYFPVQVGEVLTADMLKQCDVDGFIHGLRLFSSALGTPLAIKALLIQYHLNLLMRCDDAFLIHVHRDEVDNTYSLFEHRIKVAGDAKEWISVRPPGYEWLKDLAPIQQVAGQVHFTNKAIRDQLGEFPEKRVIDCAHADFCSNPGNLYKRLANVVEDFCGEQLCAYVGPNSFTMKTYPKTSSVYQQAVKALFFISDHY